MTSELDRLAQFYGADTPLDYVSDAWGNTLCTMTPAEAIKLHNEQDWDPSGYRVLVASEPGAVVLLDADGTPLLRLPEPV